MSRGRGEDKQPGALWKQKDEVGSLWGIAFVARLARSVGRPSARLFLWFVTAYFFLTRPDRVETCREFRIKAGAPTSSWAIFKHLLTFAHCALDRLYFLMGRSDHFRIYQTGHEHIQKLFDSGRGAILLGCHLGSFEALRAISRNHSLPLYVVADFHNARRLNAILSLFGDNERTHFLDAGGDRVSLGLKVKEAVEKGGLVAILADRAGHGRSALVDFFGEKASFPVGPYLLAHHAACPVYFTTSFYTAPGQYELLCEPLFERVQLERGAREEALTACAQLYASRLERYARRVPDNWFNFYPFWSAR